jgi:hypothetical protein
VYLHANSYVCKRPTWILRRKAGEQADYVGKGLRLEVVLAGATTPEPLVVRDLVEVDLWSQLSTDLPELLALLDWRDGWFDGRIAPGRTSDVKCLAGAFRGGPFQGALPAGSPFISSFVPVPKNVQVVLLHVSNLIAFRRVPRRRAVGKNTTVFVNRANRYRKLFLSLARSCG